MRFAGGILAAILAGPLAAQEGGFDIGATADCMEEALTSEERRFCVGAATRQCIDYAADPALAESCARQETAWWESRMAAVQQEIAASADAAQAGALMRVQAAWLDYRDSSCAFEQAFGAAEISEAECLLWLTGDHAVYLEDYLPAE